MDREFKEKIDFAIEYIRRLDQDSIRPGIYPVNDSFYYSVQEYDTKEEKDGITESHRKYVDVHWMVNGEERILISDVSRLTLQEEYCEEKDMILWRPGENMMQIVLRPGAYTVLYPENAHMGGVALNGPIKVKKIVGKIRYE